MMASLATSSTNKEEGSGSGKAETLDEVLHRLGMEEDELDDLGFEDEETSPKLGIKCISQAKVQTTNFFSPQTVEQHMKITWSREKESDFNHLEGNLFPVQCFYLGDWLKVTEGGPWLFCQNVVCTEEYDGLADPDWWIWSPLQHGFKS
jgi:hypothetical protein